MKPPSLLSVPMSPVPHLRPVRGHRLRHRTGPGGQGGDPRQGLHAPKGLPLLPTGEGGQPGACLDAGSLSSVMGGSVGGTGGPAQGGPCDVVSRPTPGGSPAFSGESRRKRAPGLCPWTPDFRARSLSLARFGVVGRSGTVVGLVRCPCTCPDLGTFFQKNSFSVYFFEKCVPNQV